LGANSKTDYYANYVNVHLLKPGDVLAHDFHLQDAALIKARTTLDERTIEAMKKSGSGLASLDITSIYLNSISQNHSLFRDVNKEHSLYTGIVNKLLYPMINEISHSNNIVSLLLQLRLEDEYTFQHTLSIGIISAIIAKWLGLGEKEQLKAAITGTLHDIGKCAIPLEILNKPGPLTREEFEIMKTHSTISYSIAARHPGFDEDILLGVLQHHERINGKGYPAGLRGDRISPLARIVSVADVFHAMTSERVYRNKENPLYVLEEIRREENALDPDVVQTFIKNTIPYLSGYKVLLSDGRTGTIINVNEQKLRYPLVKLDDSPYIIDLEKKDYLRIIDFFASPIQI